MPARPVGDILPPSPTFARCTLRYPRTVKADDRGDGGVGQSGPPASQGEAVGDSYSQPVFWGDGRGLADGGLVCVVHLDHVHR